MVEEEEVGEGKGKEKSTLTKKQCNYIEVEELVSILLVQWA